MVKISDLRLRKEAIIWINSVIIPGKFIAFSTNSYFLFVPAEKNKWLSFNPLPSCGKMAKPLQFIRFHNQRQSL